jgi:hypothetical protein
MRIHHSLLPLRVVGKYLHLVDTRHGTSMGGQGSGMYIRINFAHRKDIGNTVCIGIKRQD